MHYKNGRPANEGDPVISRGYAGQITVGKIHTLVAGSETCNCTVAEPVMGGVNQLTCRTIGEMYHAEDAFAAIEPKISETPQTATAPFPKAAVLTALLFLFLLFGFKADALITTNVVPVTVITTTSTNGIAIAYYQFQLPPPKFILCSYGMITNLTFGTNSLGFGANVSVTPTSWFNFAPYATNAQTDTHAASEVTNSTFTVIATGIVTNAPGTNVVQEQFQF